MQRCATCVRVVTIAAIPMLLVFIQPDIGTTIILATILVAAAGGRGNAGAAPDRPRAGRHRRRSSGRSSSHIIKHYQLDRLSSFLDTSHSSETATYNLQQSRDRHRRRRHHRDAATSRARQTNLDFVPEQHTDFIFTVVGEEFGFVGGRVLLLLFAVLLWRALPDRAPRRRIRSARS